MIKKPAELREMTDAELLQELNNAKQELFNLRFQVVLGTVKDTSRFRQVKRHIARVKTILRERQIAREMAKEAEDAQ